MDDSTRQKVKAEYPNQPLSLFKVGRYEFVFCRPRSATYEAWIDEDKTSAGLRAMAKECLAHGNPDEFEQMLEEYPTVLWDDLAKCILNMGGLGQAEVEPF